MEYPKFERLVVTVLPHHIEFLNRRLWKTGINRSVQTREAIELLMDKYDAREARKVSTPLSSRTPDDGVDNTAPDKGGESDVVHQER